MSTKLTTTQFISRADNEAKVFNGTLETGGNVQTQDFTFNLLQQASVQKNTLVTPWGGSLMVKKLFDTLWDNPEHDNDIIGVEFDKQTLLMILGQNGCEGIRITRCMNGKETMVAFGISSQGTLIGENMFRTDFNPDNGEIPPPGGEQGHGITLGEFKTIAMENQMLPGEADNIVNFYFSDWWPHHNQG